MYANYSKAIGGCANCVICTKNNKTLLFRKVIPKHSINGPWFILFKRWVLSALPYPAFGLQKRKQSRLRVESKSTCSWMHQDFRYLKNILPVLWEASLRGIVENSCETLSNVLTYNVSRTKLYKASQTSGETSSSPATLMYYCYPFQNGPDIHALCC